jgi:lysyl-tRNA synthetase class 1
VDAGTIVFEDEDGQLVEMKVTGGACKLQWKCDWAMRWTALEVDYEMSGKDLIESVQLSSRICRILGGQPPNNLIYEMFLDEKGEKISKSKGNGLAVEDWLRYAPQESLAYFMFQKPQTAKRLYFDVIPKSVDDYLLDLERYVEADPKTRLNTPSWHIHNGQPPKPEAGISYSILLNLVSAAHSDDPDVLWHYVSRYAPEANRENSPTLDKLIRFAIQYYRDFVLPTVEHRPATEPEKAALQDLHDVLADLPPGADAAEIQNRVYEVGKRHDSFGGLRNWFKALYQILLGQDSGPRMGSFIALYGVEETQILLQRAIAGEDLSA